MKILNFTQHNSTPEQQAQGVFDLVDEDKEYVKELLTFNSLPSQEELKERGKKVHEYLSFLLMTEEFDAVMLGGAPFFMGALEAVVHSLKLRALYAFSERVSSEETLPDGTVRKTNFFVHKGFVEPVSL